MNLNEFKSLVDLFFFKAAKEDPNADFLEWLNPKNKKKYTWEETSISIQKLAKVLKDNLAGGDRCLLVSENRPEWLIADLAIMLASGITVPAYTTYTEKDYKYIIEDCEPSVIIVSNNEMHNKLKNLIQEKDFIKKVISFDEIKNINKKYKYLSFDSIINTDLNENEKVKNVSLTNLPSFVDNVDVELKTKNYAPPPFAVQTRGCSCEHNGRPPIHLQHRGEAYRVPRGRGVAA